MLGIETNFTADDCGVQRNIRFPKKKMAIPPRISADVTNQVGRGSIEQSLITTNQNIMIETPKQEPRCSKKTTLIIEDVSLGDPAITCSKSDKKKKPSGTAPASVMAQEIQTNHSDEQDLL